MAVLTIILIVLVALVFLYGVLAYNGMIRARNMVDEGWSGIDVQLKRRHDLIRNLVETVKAYAAHEREVFQAVTDARTRAMSASGPAAAGAAGFRPSSRAPRIRSPRRVASTTATCSRTLAEHALVNTKIQTFTNSLIADWGHFTAREFFEIDDAPTA